MTANEPLDEVSSNNTLFHLQMVSFAFSELSDQSIVKMVSKRGKKESVIFKSMNDNWNDYVNNRFSKGNVLEGMRKIDESIVSCSHQE